MTLLALERFIREDGETIAYLRRGGKSPGVVWLGGFHSDMHGTKAQALDTWAEATGRADVMGKIMDSSQYLSDHMGEVPVMVIPCLLTRPEGLTQGEIAGFYGSILPAAWSLMLALRSRGLGSAWTTLHLAFEKEAGELLGIPETVTQTALIPIAYYKGEDFKPAPRQPSEKVTYFNGWKQRGSDATAP